MKASNLSLVDNVTLSKVINLYFGYSITFMNVIEVFILL